tara:strand:+ start:121 stop:282 length:162 start_codon:yes stop_codon:yes gene_type:complete
VELELGLERLMEQQLEQVVSIVICLATLSFLQLSSLTLAILGILNSFHLYLLF